MYAQIELDIDLEDKVFTTEGAAMVQIFIDSGGIDFPH
jgi:hypothetical protein